MVSRPSPGRAISEALCAECAFPCSQAPGRRLRVPGATPPQPGGGLLERICPVGSLFIVPRSLAGGCAPRLSGGGVTEKRILDGWGHGKAHSGGTPSRKSAFCATWEPQAAPLREASDRDAPLREAARATLPRGPWVFAAGRRSGRQGLGPVSCGLRKRREVRVMGPFPPYVRSQKWNWLLPSA